jgi:hypothetical protein
MTNPLEELNRMGLTEEAIARVIRGATGGPNSRSEQLYREKAASGCTCSVCVRYRLAHTRKHDRLYLAWVRRLPCAASAQGPCYGPVQAAHLRYSDAARGRVNPGLQQKPSDRLTTPLCASHHAMQHGGAERLFWSLVGIDPAILCDQLVRAYEGDEDGAAVVLALQRLRRGA